MKEKKQKTSTTRNRIIEEALYFFMQHDFNETTMEEIRVKAGVSNGSLYHHFPSKDELGAAIYLEGIKEYQSGLLQALEYGGTAREVICSIVSYHLRWVKEHPGWTRYLFQMRSASFMKAVEDELAQTNTSFFISFYAFFRQSMDNGTMRNMPLEICFVLLFGPCQEYSRRILSGHTTADFDTAIDEISEGTWNALRNHDNGTHET